jgi:hypothetical protein
MLLRQVLGDGVQTEYLADCLMAPLGAEPYLHQRDARGMSLDEIRAGWHTLADAVIATAQPSSSSATDR